MEERLRFVARRLEGESMTALCREFGISRKTGHKLFARYRDCGLEALADRKRRPGRVANRLPLPVEATIVALRREHPGWGGAQAPRAAPAPVRAGAGLAGALDDPRRSRPRAPRTSSGAATSRASSGSAVAGSAIP